MSKVSVTLQVPKESKEVIDALIAVLGHFKAKKPLAEAAALLPAVMIAVDGVDKLADEVKSDGLDEIAGYATCKIIEALRAESPEASGDDDVIPVVG